MIGAFNVENILAAFTVLSLSGVPIEKVATVLSGFTGLPGRMEVFSSSDSAQNLHLLSQFSLLIEQSNHVSQVMNDYTYLLQ